jgi:hypothetical protein
MNAPIGRSPPLPRAEPALGNDEPSAATSERYQAEAAFERLLRAKTSARDEDDDSDDDTSDEAPELAPGTPQPQATHSPAASATRGAASAVAAAEAPAGGLRASVEAALAAPIPPAPVSGENANTFEVSLRETLGVPVDLRAIRVPPPMPGAAAGPWTLTVSSSARDAALLARHAPRLNERLRARAVDHTHVRIEHREDDEDPV